MSMLHGVDAWFVPSNVDIESGIDFMLSLCLNYFKIWLIYILNIYMYEGLVF